MAKQDRSNDRRLRSWFARPVRLQVEPLEDRLAPAVTATLEGQPDNPWHFEGPTAIESGRPFNVVDSFNGLTPAGDLLSGRLNQPVVSRQNPDLAYIPSAGGGVWKTTNFTSATPTYTPTKGQGLPTQNFGSIAIDPLDDKIVYVGAGRESSFNSSNEDDNIYLTTDGGESWVPLINPNFLANGIVLPTAAEALDLAATR